MKETIQEITLWVGSLSGKSKSVVVLILTIALFILGAAAPNATIAIGK